MTVAAGFRCKDGVVLCSDTEMTMEGLMKYQESKMKPYFRLDSQPMFTFAGLEDHSNTCIQHIAAKIAAAEQRMKADASQGKRAQIKLVHVVEKEVLALHKTFHKYGDELYLLLVLRPRGTKDIPRLFQIVGPRVTPIPDCACIGYGEKIIPVKRLLKEFYKPSMTLQEGACLAAYLLKEARDYGIGTGGESQILMVPDAGSWNVFPVDPISPTLRAIESEYAYFKRMLQPVVVALSNYEMPPKEFDAVLDHFVSVLRTRRNRLYTAYMERIERSGEEEAN